MTHVYESGWPRRSIYYTKYLPFLKQLMHRRWRNFFSPQSEQFWKCTMFLRRLLGSLLRIFFRDGVTLDFGAAHQIASSSVLVAGAGAAAAAPVSARAGAEGPKRLLPWKNVNARWIIRCTSAMLDDALQVVSCCHRFPATNLGLWINLILKIE